MKRFSKTIMLLVVFLFGACLLNASKVYAGGVKEDEISSFLDFERAIIDLNNKKEVSAVSLGYSNSEYEEEKNEFSLKRLIVQGNVKNNYKAIKIVKYEDLQILCYESEEATEHAYNKLSKDSSLNVIIDKEESIEEYAEKDYDYSSYKNWGASSIDIGGYREFLTDNNVNKEVVVVVLDTGINTSHSMFNNRLLKDGNGKIKGYSYYNSTYKYSYYNLAFDADDTNRYSFEDDNGHGAHVAGIICSLTPSNVKILPIKIGGKDGKSTSSIIMSAYLRVINIYSKQYNIVSTNLSFSGAGKSSISDKNTFNEKCYNPLLKLNILPITAAGNESEENNIEGLNAVVVSALTKQGNEVVFDKSYSNYGKIVDISAPGSAILSAGIANKDAADSSIVAKSGTSMATPQVAGIVALLYLNPNLPSDFSADDIENMLYEASLDMGAPGKDIYYGEGILNLKYFESENTATLSFYKNGYIINNYINNENFEESFNFDIRCSNRDFKIIYTVDKKVPTFRSHILYSSSINIETTTTIYAMGIKVVNGEIVARTNLYNISYFKTTTPIEDSFTITYRGYLSNYTGNYKTLVIPSVMNGVVVKGIEPSTFKDSNIESITLPYTVETIGGYAFQNATNLKYIYAPGVTKIFISAFSNCDSLTLVSDAHPTSNDKVGAYFPSLTEMISFVFSGSENIESVSLSKLETMDEGGYNFQGLTNLKYVNLPSITSIPQGTFNQCENLKGDYYISENIESVGKNAFRNTGITSFIVGKNNPYLYSDGLGLYSQNTIVAYAVGNENLDYEILESVSIKGKNYIVTTIGEGALSYTSFNNLTIPSSINLINSFAFSNTNIETLYYNAENCTHEGYYDKESYFRSNVFDNIVTIEIGSNVINVPERLFQDVFFDNLVINSYYTKLDSSSFYRMQEQGDFNKLVFNFTNTISREYAQMIVESSIFSYSDVEYVYSKTDFQISLISYLSGHIYRTIDGDYFVYSKNPLINKISVSSSSNDGGTITPSGIAYYEKGESVTYFFNPKNGYYLKEVIVDGVYVNDNSLSEIIKNGYTFTNLTSDHTISAVFEACVYSITYRDEIGAILYNLEPTSYTYGIGAMLPVLEDKEGYYFVGWFEANDFNEPIYKISRTDIGDKLYYSKYEIKRYFIDVIQSDNGRISEEKDSYEHGTDAHFVIEANEGYYIESLIIDNTLYSSSMINLNEYTFENIKGNHTIKAIFAPRNDIKYTVKHWKQSLTSQDAVIFGNKYYVLDYIDSTKVGTTGTETNATFNGYIGFTGATITQKVILGDGSTIVDVLYNRNNYSVNVIRSEEGIEDIIGEATYLYGEAVKLKAILTEGYEWVIWESLNKNVIASSENSEYEFIMPSSNIEFMAIAKIKQYTIAITIDIGGVVSQNSSITLNHGEDQTLVFTPENGYKVVSILVDNMELGENELNNAILEGYTFESISKNHTIEVIFGEDAQMYMIKVEVQGEGTVTPSRNVLVNHGKNHLFTFEANEGSYISDVIIDGKSIGVLKSYKFVDVKSNHEVKVVFEKKTFKVDVSIENNGKFESDIDLNKVQYGDNVTITIEADEGYQINKVKVNKVVVDIKNNVLELVDIKENVDVTITFKKRSQEEIIVDGVSSSKEGISCSLNKEGSVTDFLFVVFSMLGFAFFKKRIYR